MTLTWFASAKANSDSIMRVSKRSGEFALMMPNSVGVGLDGRAPAVHDLGHGDRVERRHGVELRAAVRLVGLGMSAICRSRWRVSGGQVGGVADGVAGRVEVVEDVRQPHHAHEVVERRVAPGVALAHERRALGGREDEVVGRELDVARGVAGLQRKRDGIVRSCSSTNAGIEEHDLASTRLARRAEAGRSAPSCRNSMPISETRRIQPRSSVSRESSVRISSGGRRCSNMRRERTAGGRRHARSGAARPAGARPEAAAVPSAPGRHRSRRGRSGQRSSRPPVMPCGRIRRTATMIAASPRSRRPGRSPTCRLTTREPVLQPPEHLRDRRQHDRADNGAG